MNRRFTKAALVAAAAMTISLASPVSASAQESASATGVPASSPQTVTPQARLATATPQATAPVGVSLRLYRGYNWEHRVSSSNTISTDVAINVALADSRFNVSKITADVYINGKKRTNVRLSSSSNASGFATWSRAYGPGKTQFRNVVVEGWFSGIGDTSTRTYALPTVSNTITVKRAREYSSFWVTKRGKKLTFKATGFRAYANNGKLVPSSKVILQRKVGKKWKTVKKFNIKKSGKKTIKITQRKKFRYRMLIKGTATADGINAVTKRKI